MGAAAGFSSNHLDIPALLCCNDHYLRGCFFALFGRKIDRFLWEVSFRSRLSFFFPSYLVKQYTELTKTIKKNVVESNLNYH